jgi:hypothetical protein
MAIKSKRHIILRDLKPGVAPIEMQEKPVRVATIIDEPDLVKRGYELIHHQNVFLEDRHHDWTWEDGMFRYFTRVADKADVIVVFELA